MSQNPEEGRLTPEQQAEQLRLARKQTVEMRRQYREMRNEKAAKDKAERWRVNHGKQHRAAYEAIDDVSRGGNPLNRRNRRKMAHGLNVFKTPEGWQHFNNHYGDKYGRREPLSNYSGPEVFPIKSNITQALENAKVTPKKEDQ